jgi:thiol:disulfide interchange protein DsbA
MIRIIAITLITLVSFTLSSKEKTDVIEFFYFGCPHCQKIEPELQDWVNKNKENVNFEKIPVDFGGLTKKAAEHYYISMYLDMDKDFTDLYFKELVTNRSKISDEIAFKILHVLGAKKESINEAQNSYFLKSKMEKLTELTEKFKIIQVPTFIVNSNNKVMHDKNTFKNLDNLVK